MGVAQRIVLGVSVFAVVVLGVSSAAPAGRRVPPQKIALAAVARLQAAGRIDPADAARYRKAITRAVALIPRVPASRATPLRSQLAQAAAIAPKLTAPRALAVFSQLEVNDDWFANHGPAASQTDITDADGVVYRYFSGGFEFHPLGNFAALNADALSKNVTATTQARERARRSRRPRGRGRGRLGVLLRLRRRARAVDERVRAGRRGAVVRASREGRHGRLGTAAGGGALGVPRGARPARAGHELRPLDQAVQLQPRRRAERAAPGCDLARLVREADLRLAGRDAWPPR